MTDRCPKCGADVRVGDVECGRCGVILKKARAVATPPQAVTPSTFAPSAPAGPVREHVSPTRSTATVSADTPPLNLPVTRPGLRARRDVLESLARLFEAGVPPSEALKTLAPMASGSLRRSLPAVAAALDGGATLAAAFEVAPDLIDPSDRGLIRAAEAIGEVDGAFRALALALEQRIALRARLIRAVAYPVFLLVTGVLLSPLPSVFLSGRSYLAALVPSLVWAAALIGLAGALVAVSAMPAVRVLFWKLPWPATLYVRHVRNRFARGLSAALGAGLGARDALGLAAGTTTDLHAERAIARLSLDDALSASLFRAQLIAPEERVVIVAAERSGRMPDALADLATRGEESLARGMTTAMWLLNITVTGIAVFMAVQSVLEGHRAITSAVDGAMKELERELPPGFTLD
ncbi:MAG: type II secretion system F family protein [Myxococcales bacterium]|nr:type II secretion system F family protein [Myxococcales bacterium]